MKPEDFKREWDIQEFKNYIWERIGRTNDLYPNWMLSEFSEYWGMKPGGRKKMCWQLKGYNKSGQFNITMRLAQWKTRSLEWHPKRWAEKDKPMKPTKWKPTNDSPEAREEAKRIKEGYERLKNKPKVPYQSTGIIGMRLREVRRQSELSRQANQSFDDYE